MSNSNCRMGMLVASELCFLSWIATVFYLFSHCGLSAHACGLNSSFQNLDYIHSNEGERSKPYLLDLFAMPSLSYRLCVDNSLSFGHQGSEKLLPVSVTSHCKA